MKIVINRIGNFNFEVGDFIDFYSLWLNLDWIWAIWLCYLAVIMNKLCISFLQSGENKSTIKLLNRNTVRMTPRLSVRMTPRLSLDFCSYSMLIRSNYAFKSWWNVIELNSSTERQYETNEFNCVQFVIVHQTVRAVWLLAMQWPSSGDIIHMIQN